MSGFPIFVVGENLSSSTNSDDIVTVSELAGMIASGRFGRSAGVVSCGQGVSQRDVDYLRNVQEDAGADGLRIRDADLAEPASRTVTHKARSENVLISDLRRVGGGDFTARLQVSDTNEMLLDHGSSDHLSGMLLMEAGRQMALAVAETYFVPKDRGRCRFVINDWRTKFHRFLAPLSAELVLNLDHSREDQSGVLRFTSRCEIVQADRVAAVHDVTFSAFPAARIREIEERQADEVIRTIADRTAVVSLSGHGSER